MLLEGVGKKVSKALSNWFEREHPDGPPGDLQKALNIPYMGGGHWYGGTGPSWGRIAFLDSLFIDQDLLKRFADYEEMDEFPEGTFTLNVYSDDATNQNPDTDKAIWAHSTDKDTQGEVNGVLSRCRADDLAWEAVRELCKYGQIYCEIIAPDKKQGVAGAQFMPAPTVRRVESTRDGLLGFVQDPNGSSFINPSAYFDLASNPGRSLDDAVAFTPLEVVHWRLRMKYINSVYGYSILEPARPAWKRLALLEDGTLVYKFERAHQRFAFYVDVGKTNKRKMQAEVNRARDTLRRKKMTASDGTLDLKRDILSGDEDFFIGVQDGKRTTDIELLSAPDYSETDTLRHFRQKFATSVSVPPSRYGWEDRSDSRNMISSTSIEFARAVMRVQRAYVRGWTDVCNRHFAMTGKIPDQDTWAIRMNVPSQIMELARMEIMSARAGVARDMQDYVGVKYILMHIFQFSEDLAVSVMKEKNQEQLNAAKVEGQARKMEMGESFEGSRPYSEDELLGRIGKNPELVARLGRISGLLEDIRLASV